MMKRFLFDIETNGLLDTMDKIHCAVLMCYDTGTVMKFPPNTVKQAIDFLQNAEWICGHNVIEFDIPAIKICYPDFEPRGQVVDTLVMSRLIKANVISEDVVRHDMPKRLWGSHSLKAWGYRLGTSKDEFDAGDWQTYSHEMLDYNAQDVVVTQALLLELESAGFSKESIQLEHELAEVCYRIGNNGWTFDEKAAGKLYAKLSKRRSELEDELTTLFPPWTVETEFIPKKDNKARGYIKGEPFIKVKEVQFNPNSRIHIHKCLVDKYGWKPRQWSAQGAATIDEAILGELHYPEAQQLAEFFMLQKRIGQLAEGKAAWLKLVSSDGKLRHRIISGGTISGRASHRSPNLGQVPRASAPYGKECRDLFTAPRGWLICGSDLAAIELRMLASYLHPMDDGNYSKHILEGDIHSFNQKSFGCKTRDQSKRAIFSMIYGAGDRLLGEIVGGSAKDGKKLKQNFDQSIPAFASLKRKLATASKRGYLVGLDGRHLYLKSAHRSLSQLLQSGAAVVCKKWLALVNAEIEDTLEGQSFIMGWIHDELQIACNNEETAEYVGNITKRMAEKAGEELGVRIPIAAAYQVAPTWAGSH